MNDEPQNLAAEYVLGVLDEAERREAERRIAREPAFAAEVAYWEARLGALAEDVTEVGPPARVWGSIEKTPYDDPEALARAATRAEVRQPGFMERTLGASPSAGFGAGLLGSFAAGFAGSMVATSFFASLGNGFASPDLTPSLAEERDTDIGGLVSADSDFDLDGDFDGVDVDI